MKNSLSVIIVCLLWLWIPTAAQSNEQHEVELTKTQKPEAKKPEPKKEQSSSDTLDFSGTGRPGQQTAGESRGSCSNTAKPIKAMLPESNSGKTVLGHPRFWVYFPESTAENVEVEFIVQDSNRQDVWRSRSTLDSRSGYHSFSVPETETPLEIGQWYRWYVKLYCGERVASIQYVQGWVNRVTLDFQLDLELQQTQNHHSTYANHRIWYEAVSELLSSYHHDPSNITLEQDWRNIIEAKGVSLHQLPSLEINR